MCLIFYQGIRTRISTQVVLRWLIQRGIVPLVKSSHPQRMRENLDVFDFALTENEMRQIGELDTGHTCFLRRNTGAAVTAFLKQATSGSAPSGMVQK